MSRYFLKDAIASLRHSSSRVSASVTRVCAACSRTVALHCQLSLTRVWKMTQAKARMRIASRFAMQMICMVRERNLRQKEKKLSKQETTGDVENYGCGRLKLIRMHILIIFVASCLINRSLASISSYFLRWSNLPRACFANYYIVAYYISITLAIAALLKKKKNKWKSI